VRHLPHNGQHINHQLGIEGTATSSNHIIEVAEVLGIEAARSCIVDQIGYTMREHGLTVDARHIMLLGDCMTTKVYPLATLAPISC